jgi:hypothetical protein
MAAPRAGKAAIAAPRPIKTGAIVPPWRYDTVRIDLMRCADLRMGRHSPFAAPPLRPRGNSSEGRETAVEQPWRAADGSSGRGSRQIGERQPHGRRSLLGAYGRKKCAGLEIGGAIV